MPLSILLAVAEAGLGSGGELAEQLTADGHEVHQAHHSRDAVALLAGRRLDVLILGALEIPAAALAPLLVGVDELDALRAYEAGSDHHLPVGAGYVHQRAVLTRWRGVRGVRRGACGASARSDRHAGARGPRGGDACRGERDGGRTVGRAGQRSAAGVHQGRVAARRVRLSLGGAHADGGLARLPAAAAQARRARRARW